jgi:hypothetical protein
MVTWTVLSLGLLLGRSSVPLLDTLLEAWSVAPLETSMEASKRVLDIVQRSQDRR